MGTRIVSSISVAVILLAGGAGRAQIGDPGQGGMTPEPIGPEGDLRVVCEDYANNFGARPPECQTEVSFGAHAQFPNVCRISPVVGTTSSYRCIDGTNAGNTCTDDAGCPGGYCDDPVRVELVYPSEPNPGITYAPAVLMHGGGVDQGFRDVHSQTHPRGPNDYPIHPVNPYQDLVRRLVAKGLVVALPIFPSQGQAHSVGKKAARAATCMMERMDPTRCTAAEGDRPCFAPLAGRVAWTAGNKENIIYIAHSSGAVGGMYLPQELGYALKGLIMLDPAKDDQWLSDPPNSINTRTPVVHFYPDYYGPFAKNAVNNTMRIGEHAQGPWVPIGIRDYPGCNPDTGCHEAHHCMGLENDMSYEENNCMCGAYCPQTVAVMCTSGADGFLGGPCGNGDINCGTGGRCGVCTKTADCGGNRVCGQGTKCRNNAALRPTGHTWKFHRDEGFPGDEGVAAGTILMRYVIAYSGCLGAIKGAQMQSWVNGRSRQLDDAGTGGSCTRNGLTDGICSAETTKAGCDAADGGACFWAQNIDGGRVIRINDSETITSTNGGYTRSSPGERWYAAPATNVNWGFNAAAPGSFVERQERLSSVPGDPMFIRCQSGPGTF